MTENNKRFVTMANIDLEVSIKDNLTKKYPFSLCCENLDEFESLLNEVTNVCAEMNKAWGQTQRFEAYNKRLMEENKQLNQAISDWKGSYDELYQDIKILEKENKELKAKVDDKEVAVEVECEKLMQKVFNLINAKIKLYSHKPVSAPISQPMSVNFDADVDRLARLSELEALKEELTE